MKTKVVVATMLVLLALSTVGCAGGAKKPANNAPVASEVATADLPGDVPANAGDLEYIRSLGKSHKGEMLYALVVAIEDTQAAAEKAALDTLSQVGDVQAYFVVEPASHLSGLPAGKWFVFETYRAQPSQDTIDFMDRGPSPATVYKVTVKCTDPIPVVEDQEGAGTQ